MALKHAFVSAKSDGADPTLVQPSNWNADHVVDTDGVLIVADSTTPSTPASGYVNLFGKTIAGRHLPAVIGPSGLDTALQPFFGRNKVGIWAPLGNTTTSPVSNIGIAAPVYSGTATARNVATTNFASQLRRIGVVSAATAASIARAGTGVMQFYTGNASNVGGFFAIFRFMCSDAATVAGARTFVGLSQASFGNAEASSLTNMIGMGHDAADTNMYMMSNDGSGTATKTSLGANFPVNTLSIDVYELALFCAPGASSVGWQVTRLNTGDVASGTISTDLPASTQLLLPQFARNNNTTALAVGIDVIGMYIETDN